MIMVFVVIFHQETRENKGLVYSAASVAPTDPKNFNVDNVRVAKILVSFVKLVGRFTVMLVGRCTVASCASRFMR